MPGLALRCLVRHHRKPGLLEGLKPFRRRRYYQRPCLHCHQSSARHQWGPAACRPVACRTGSASCISFTSSTPPFGMVYSAKRAAQGLLASQPTARNLQPAQSWRDWAAASGCHNLSDHIEPRTVHNVFDSVNCGFFANHCPEEDESEGLDLDWTPHVDVAENGHTPIPSCSRVRIRLMQALPSTTSLPPGSTSPQSIRRTLSRLPVGRKRQASQTPDLLVDRYLH